ncbi:MAG: hypothetical protein AAF771_04080 [Pseudomonadota bacterium]
MSRRIRRIVQTIAAVATIATVFFLGWQIWIEAAAQRAQAQLDAVELAAPRYVMRQNGLSDEELFSDNFERRASPQNPYLPISLEISVFNETGLELQFAFPSFSCGDGEVLGPSPAAFEALSVTFLDGLVEQLATRNGRVFLPKGTHTFTLGVDISPEMAGAASLYALVVSISIPRGIEDAAQRALAPVLPDDFFADLARREVIAFSWGESAPAIAETCGNSYRQTRGQMIGALWGGDGEIPWHTFDSVNVSAIIRGG